MEERRGHGGANSRRSRSIFFHNRAFPFFSFFFYIKWLIRVEEETLISRKHRIRANSRVFRRRNRYTEITSTAFQSTFQKRNRACIGAGCGRGWKSWNILNSTARRGREEGGIGRQSFMKRRQSDRILFTRAVSSFSLRPFIASAPIVSPVILLTRPRRMRRNAW